MDGIGDVDGAEGLGWGDHMRPEKDMEGCFVELLYVILT